MKIISYNVNGIRAAIKKDFLHWLKATDADVVCLQEIKATPDQLNIFDFTELGYESFWYPAQKKGYSGVAILSKKAPKHVEYGCGIEDYDQEGRVIRADFEGVSILNVYMPSGASGDERQAFKFRWLADFKVYVNQLKQTFEDLVICGDYNICHTEMDIHNPKANAKSSGFLPEERNWMTEFFDSGFIDTFRYFNPEPHNYTWWSYRANARVKNLGWRIDYLSASRNMENRLMRAAILSEAKHSDHCPVLLEIEE